jgi:glycosyltransferase involved in cell wall biosynthesis
MRILHLVYDHPENPWVGGGGAVRVFELASRLAQRGHRVTVVSGNYPGARDTVEGNLSYRFVGSDRGYARSTFSYAARAARYVLCQGKRFDVVVEDFAPWNPVFARFLTKRPVVLHLNHREGSGILRRWPVVGAPFYVLEALYPRWHRHVTALSVGTREKIGRPDAVVVPAGISGRVLEARAEPEENFVLYVGRLHIKNKGLDTLMEAVKTLPGTRLVMAGRGPDEARLRRMAEGLPVEFAGFVSEEEKLSLLRRCRLLVLPSRFEGWGIVVLEAAACGRPVVVSDIPELGFAVEGGFGLDFRTGNAGDLAARIRAMLENADQRRRMGENGRGVAAAHTWERIAEEYEAYLRGVATGTARRT